jgi:hypothetical protein
MVMDDCEYEDYLHALGVLDHSPIRPARDGFIGETVFAERWKHFIVKQPKGSFTSWMTTPNAMLAGILSDLPARITQRHASICATVACWLGTNMGRCTLDTAKRLMAVTHDRDAYVAAWAIANKRVHFVNSGNRTIEFLLAPPDHYGKLLFHGYGLIKRPALTVEDLETVDQFWYWLGGPDGRSVVQGCENEVTKRQAAEYRKQRSLNGADRNG